MKKQKRGDYFTCEACGKTYLKSWSDEEAKKEMKDIWGEIPPEERAIICDDCWKKRTKKEIIAMGEKYKSRRGAK